MPILAASNDSVLQYGGDVTPSQAWLQLQEHPDATLIDVRTQPEWVFSGLPNLNPISKRVHTISWKLYPTMEVNTRFVEAVAEVVAEKNTPIYFLCKTGGRSMDAAIAMTQAGYRRCYNIADGFEGDRNEDGQRGSLSGWKASNLPWEQA